MSKAKIAAIKICCQFDETTVRYYDMLVEEYVRPGPSITLCNSGAEMGYNENFVTIHRYAWPQIKETIDKLFKQKFPQFRESDDPIHELIKRNN